MDGRADKVVSPRDAIANLAAIALAVALLAVGIAYGIDALGRNAGQADESASAKALVTVNVSGVALAVPSKWLRFGDRPESAFSDRLDLDLELDLGGKVAVPVTLTFVPKTRAKASSALLDSVYLQHFGKAERDGIPGLIGKPLNGDTGFQGETVWYDPIRVNPFVAKCAAPVGSDDAVSCLRTLALDSGLAAILGFPDTVLGLWRSFDAPLAALFEKIGAGRIER